MKNIAELTPLQGVAAVLVSLSLPLVLSFALPIELRISFFHASGTAVALGWPLWVENSVRETTRTGSSKFSVAMVLFSVVIAAIQTPTGHLEWVAPLAIAAYSTCILRSAIQVASFRNRSGVFGTAAIAAALFLLPIGIYFVLKTLRTGGPNRPAFVGGSNP